MSLTNLAALALCNLDLSHNGIVAIHAMKFRVSWFGFRITAYTYIHIYKCATLHIHVIVFYVVFELIYRNFQSIQFNLRSNLNLIAIV